MTAVSWKIIEHGWAVHGSDGDQVGVVFLVVGDENSCEECRHLPGHEPPESAEISPEKASFMDRAREEIEHLTGEDCTN